MTVRELRGRSRWLTVVVLAVAAVSVGCEPRSSFLPFGFGSGCSSMVSTAPMRIAYGDAADTFGDLYLPALHRGPLPVVVLVHGGAWSQNRALDNAAPIAESLVQRGVAVWNIEYRRVNGAGGWPVTLTDVAAAVDALTTVVQQRCGNRLDLNRVHLAGHSAGGHLAAWAAGRGALPPDAPGAHPRIRVRSVTVMAGVFDLALAVTAGNDNAVPALLGGLPDQVPDRYHLASPISHLPIGAHITAVHGDADRVVSVDQSRRYTSAAAAAGDTADLRVLSGVGHADFLDTSTPAWAVAQQAILDNVNTFR